jgi:hypothetical protein
VKEDSKQDHSRQNQKGRQNHLNDAAIERELNEPEVSWYEGLVGAMNFAVRSSIQEIPRKKFTYCLAFTSVFVVVLSSLVINSVI